MRGGGIMNTKDKQATHIGAFIPKDLTCALNELEKMILPQVLEEYRKGILGQNSSYCFKLGLWIRTNWGLWERSRLARYFNKLEIHHPDDMSQIILNTFWRYLNGKPIELETEILGCKKYRDGV
jgi:hypothetical protein